MPKNYFDIIATLPHAMHQADLGVNLPSLEAAVEYIDKMDFSLIRNKLLSEDPLLCRRWTLPEAEIAIQYYKNFLYLNKKYSSQFPVLPPLLEVDEIWHHHIMGTRQYKGDCENIFGYFFITTPILVRVVWRIKRTSIQHSMLCKIYMRLNSGKR